MQITLNEDEIIEAVKAHVLGQINVAENQNISIALKAGRGENGFTATLDIVPAVTMATTTTASKAAPVAQAVNQPAPKTSGNPFAKAASATKAELKAEPETIPEPQTSDEEPAGEPDLGDTGPVDLNEEAISETSQPEAEPEKPRSIFSKAKAG